MNRKSDRAAPATLRATWEGDEEYYLPWRPAGTQRAGAMTGTSNLIHITTITVGVFALGCDRNTVAKQLTTKADVEAMLAAEIPVGSGRQDALNVLRRHKFDHLFDPKRSEIRGILRNVEQNGMISRSIVVRIQIDGDNRVSTSAVREVFTGP